MTPPATPLRFLGIKGIFTQIQVHVRVETRCSLFCQRDSKNIGIISIFPIPILLFSLYNKEKILGGLTNEHTCT